MKLIRKLLNIFRGEQNLNKLIKRGLKVGVQFKRMGGVIIDPSHCWHIEIGDNVTLAPRVHILAHDASTKIFLNYTRVANVKIGNRVFVGADTIILPGVTVGNNVVVGAGSVVTKDIPDNSLAVGTPARVISTLDAYLQKENENMKKENMFSKEYTLQNKNFSEKQRTEMLKSCMDFKEIFVE